MSRGKVKESERVRENVQDKNDGRTKRERNDGSPRLMDVHIHSCLQIRQNRGKHKDHVLVVGVYHLQDTDKRPTYLLTYLLVYLIYFSKGLILEINKYRFISKKRNFINTLYYV